MAKYNFGKQLKKMRESLGWSQFDLARKMGAHPTIPNRLETRKKVPSIKTLEQLRAVFSPKFGDEATLKLLLGSVTFGAIPPPPAEELLARGYSKLNKTLGLLPLLREVFTDITLSELEMKVEVLKMASEFLPVLQETFGDITISELERKLEIWKQGVDGLSTMMRHHTLGSTTE